MEDDFIVSADELEPLPKPDMGALMRSTLCDRDRGTCVLGTSPRRSSRLGYMS